MDLKFGIAILSLLTLLLPILIRAVSAVIVSRCWLGSRLVSSHLILLLPEKDAITSCMKHAALLPFQDCLMVMKVRKIL